MIGKLTHTLTGAVCVMVVATGLALGASSNNKDVKKGFHSDITNDYGQVMAIDDAGMAVVKSHMGQSYTVSGKGLKVGDHVSCQTTDGKYTTCRKD